MSISVGVVAPASRIADEEFEIGIQQLKENGFQVKVHPQNYKEHLFFAGTDEQRAHALFDYAMDSRLEVIWCARGGYGAARLLPLLEELTRKRGRPPKKLLVGYSDVTALFDYVRSRWGWSVLHAPMPGLRKFCFMELDEHAALIQWIKKEVPMRPWGAMKLQWVGKKPVKPIDGEVVGGNLSVWLSLLATPFEPKIKGKILFFEDVDEGLYRLDRMVNHLMMSGRMRGAKAVVMGNFLNCKDNVPMVLNRVPSLKDRKRMVLDPKPHELRPLRRKLDEKKVIPIIFSKFADSIGVPLAQGLPVGHGPDRYSFPMGGRFRLMPSGELKLLHWEWTGKKNSAKR